MCVVGQHITPQNYRVSESIHHHAPGICNVPDPRRTCKKTRRPLKRKRKRERDVGNAPSFKSLAISCMHGTFFSFFFFFLIFRTQIPYAPIMPDNTALRGRPLHPLQMRRFSQIDRPRSPNSFTINAKFVRLPPRV